MIRFILWCFSFKFNNILSERDIYLLIDVFKYHDMQLKS